MIREPSVAGIECDIRDRNDAWHHLKNVGSVNIGRISHTKHGKLRRVVNHTERAVELSVSVPRELV